MNIELQEIGDKNFLKYLRGMIEGWFLRFGRFGRFRF